MKNGSQKEKKYTDIGEIFEKFYPKLLFYATQFLSQEEAEDVVQDAFFELWKRRDEIHFGDKIQAYLYKFVYTRSLNELNHKKIENKYTQEAILLNKQKLEAYDLEDKNNIIYKIENDELRAKINQAINTLPEKCKKVFKLSYIYDMKNQEIADVLGISLRTVEAHMYHALKQLRLLLGH